MVWLSTVIRDLDKEYPRLDEGLYGGFSAALSRFNHSLIVNEALTESLQVSVDGVKHIVNEVLRKRAIHGKVTLARLTLISDSHEQTAWHTVTDADQRCMVPVS